MCPGSLVKPVFLLRLVRLTMLKLQNLLLPRPSNGRCSCRYGCCKIGTRRTLSGRYYCSTCMVAYSGQLCECNRVGCCLRQNQNGNLANLVFMILMSTLTWWFMRLLRSICRLNLPLMIKQISNHPKVIFFITLFT